MPSRHRLRKRNLTDGITVSQVADLDCNSFRAWIYRQRSQLFPQSLPRTARSRRGIPCATAALPRPSSPPFSPGQDDTAPTGKIRDVCLQSHILHPISETASLSTLWSKILSPTQEEPFYQTQGSINKEGQKARQFRTDRQ